MMEINRQPLRHPAVASSQGARKEGAIMSDAHGPARWWRPWPARRGGRSVEPQSSTDSVDNFVHKRPLMLAKANADAPALRLPKV
jgi:hypothetical protein